MNSVEEEAREGHKWKLVSVRKQGTVNETTNGPILSPQLDNEFRMEISVEHMDGR